MEHQTTNDSQFIKTMSLVLGALVLFFFVIVTIANVIVEPANTAPNAAKVAAMSERVAPVGRVRTSLAESGAVAAETAPAEPKSAKQLVEMACIACHGVATAAALNAPALGDAVAWQERLSGGLDNLVNNAIKGIGNMPARGGTAFSDEEMRLAVEYLAGQ